MFRFEICSGNRIVYAVDAEWRVCTNILMFLEYVIPLEDPNNPIYYARLAVRFIREQLVKQRKEHPSVLIGGFDHETPTEPRLYRANKSGVFTVKDKVSIGDHRHFVGFVLSEKKFHPDRTTSEELVEIGECFRLMVKHHTDDYKGTDRLTSVVVSPSALGSSSHQPSSSVDSNDKMTATFGNDWQQSFDCSDKGAHGAKETDVQKVVKDCRTNMAASNSIMFSLKRSRVVNVKVTDCQLEQIQLLASQSGAATPTVHLDGSERYYKIVCQTEENYAHIVSELRERRIGFEVDCVMFPLETYKDILSL